MTDRDVFRSIAKLACKRQNKKLYLWCVRMNQRSLHRSWGWITFPKLIRQHKKDAA